MLSRDDAGALGENGRRREGSEKQWTGKALQIQGQREELGICFSARRSSRSQALTVKRQGNHGLELRTYVKISSQKRPKRYTQNGGGLQNERGKKFLYRSYNVQILPGDNCVVANAPGVFRTLLALNLYKINLGILGLCTERQTAED